MIKVLFVCTGNICRSPSAEAVLRNILRNYKRADEFHIESAGTHGYHVGSEPDKRAVLAARVRGISMEGIRARKVISEDFSKFDHIIAMDQGHYRILNAMMPPDSFAKLSLFTDYCDLGDIKDVPDPYYGGEQEFESMLDMIQHGVERMLPMIRK